MGPSTRPAHPARPSAPINVWFACVLSLAATSASAADDAALQRCRAVADTAARLACYDALPLSAPGVPATTAAPGAAAPPAAAALQSTAVQRFGQERQGEPDAISSHIPGLFEGWGPRTRIKLANGQVWQVADDSSGVYYLKDAKATVRRAALGGFVMDIDGANRVPRVQRVD